MKSEPTLTGRQEETPSRKGEKPSGERDTATGPLASIVLHTPISVIVPTLREVANVRLLLERFRQLRDKTEAEIEVIIVDDNSCDGTEEAVEASGFPWARCIVRTMNPGLSPSVLAGFAEATHPVLVCMDCDLSHPPERIPDLVWALERGYRFALGSRYVPGATTDERWGLFRWLNSKVATLLARPLTRVRDPMSGFFALRREEFERAQQLDPVGYKIALELLVKARIEEAGEVPIHFADRIHGESKLTVRQQFLYLKHLRSLYLYRFPIRTELLQFLGVGGSGVLVNFALLTLLSLVGASDSVALSGGILGSVLSNFLLNRRFTFPHGRRGNLWKQMGGYGAVTAVGALLNYGVALSLRQTLFMEIPFGLYLSALAGIIVGTVTNFTGYRWLVFRR